MMVTSKVSFVKLPFKTADALFTVDCIKMSGPIEKDFSTGIKKIKQTNENLINFLIIKFIIEG